MFVSGVCAVLYRVNEWTDFDQTAIFEIPFFFLGKLKNINFVKCSCHAGHHLSKILILMLGLSVKQPKKCPSLTDSTLRLTITVVLCSYLI